MSAIILEDLLAPEVPQSLADSNEVELDEYAEQAYLAYAMSVVMGRALPMLCDGQKPVQRRILYDMLRLGLTDKAKHVKCARFVGDVLGKYHPHGDSSVYDAAVRMAQPFALRYPLVDGQGNFGSRDGDGAAAMRYTEARLTPFAELLLGELDQGTVDFVPTYDGTMLEPALLPARLPVLLLNGASGIAVGMATEIPSHNLTEVADACEHLIRNPEATLADILQLLPGPDFPCGGQLITSADDVAKAYTSGRGALRVRARWVVEPLARGQWQIAVTELPPDSSTAKVMAEIETLTNPQLKSGKKTLTQDQANLKALVLSVVDRISDDSDEKHPVRLVIEPRSSRQSPEEVMQVLLAHTSLELNFPMNLVTIGQDSKPCQKGLMQVLTEWVAFRYETVIRRTKHRLEQVRSRMHILEGRITIFTHIDDVIRIIRAAEDARAELMERYSLSDIQATDILEIRLRQLANMEQLKLENELADLRKEESFLQGLLDNRKALTRQILIELDADRKKFGDARRTLIEPAERITTSSVVATSDDPITLIISKHGWVRARSGHKVDTATLTWKPGDSALAIIETRSAQTLVILDSSGRAYNVPAASAPNGRGEGVPLSSMIDLGANTVAHAFMLAPGMLYLLSTSAGYGFLCPSAGLETRQKAGKVLMTGVDGDTIFAPIALPESAVTDGGEVVVAASSGKLLVFKLVELKQMAKGKGVQMISVGGKDKVALVAAFELPIDTLTVDVDTASSKKYVDGLIVAGPALGAHRGKRARSGAALMGKSRATAVTATLGEAIPTELPKAEESAPKADASASEMPASVEEAPDTVEESPAKASTFDDDDLI